MVLKDKKATAPKRNTKADDDGAFILANIENRLTSNILPSLRSYLEPVCNLKASFCKENTDKHLVAKRFVPFLAQVLKQSSNALSHLPNLDEEASKLKADDLFMSIEFTLDCFECLRQWLIGSPFEIEMQRSWLVRKYIGSRRFHEALTQDVQLLHSLCVRISTQEKASIMGVTSYRKGDVNLKLPHPDHAKDLPQNVIVLMVGAVTDFVVCVAEIGLDELSLLEKMVPIVQQLDPWLSMLEHDKEEKQRSLIFREVNKCLMSILSNNSRIQTCLLESLCSLALRECSLSSMRCHFCKVARSICSKVSSQGPRNIDLAIQICEEALSKMGQVHELRGGCGTQEILELTECYARFCQTAKRYSSGWQYIRSIANMLMGDSSSMSVMEYYAVGLMLLCNPIDMEHQEKPNAKILHTSAIDIMADSNVFGSLEIAIKVVQNVIACLGKSARVTLADACSNENKPSWEKEDLKGSVTTFRALDFFRRSAFSYAQIQWDAFMARNQDVSMPQECVNTLKQCLLMFCELLITGLGCSNLTSEETELFRRGSKSFFLAAIAALKLSLISHGGSEECIKLIKRFLDSPFAGEEEIKWLLSSSYNMGVQLFNMKLYALACEPFTITYVTSWVRATAENVRNLSDTESQQYTDLVLDACTKSNIFFDTLNRNGLPSEAFEIFRESMIKWANTDLAGIEKHSAHNLLQGWLKKVFSLRLRKEIDDEENLICSFIVGSYPPLQAGTVGLLLEKELLLYDDMEELDPVLSRKLKRKLLDILLDEVYTDSSVFMQRSKILQEKGRLCRLDGVEGCSDCLNYLTQAIDILLTNRNVGDDKCMLLNINLQLANNYFLRACCSQEVDPTADGFLEDIQNGLHMCEDILSQKLSFNEQLLMHLPSTIGLLQNCADLLALKGYSSILYTVYELLLTASFITVSDPVTAFLGVFGDRKVSHLFCCSLFPCSFKELTLQTLGLDLDSESMLQNMVNKSRKQVLSGFLCEIKHSYEDDDVLVTKQWEEMSHSSDDAKTIEDIIRASQALSKLAEFRQERGKLEEALKYAREALHFRLKLVNRYFKVSSKSPSNTDSEAELSEKVVFLHASGRMAVRNWPGINLKERAEVGPSQWQIINVYLESLMQVGVLSEMLGLVDDADSSFREGHQIAKAQGLVFAEGIFQSCLGETLRKRHMWDQARNSFETANCLFDQCRVGTFCNFCMQLARATLELRIADLRRRQSDKSTVLPSETVELALEMYRHAEEKIYSLVFDLIQVHVTPDEKIDFRFSARHGPDGNGTAEKLCIKSTYFKDEKGSSRNSYQSSVDGYSVPRKSSIRNEGCCAENPPGRIAKQVFNVVGPSIENTRLTRRRTTTKSSSVSVSKETVEELCSETQSKLNVGKCEIHASGKGRLGSRRGKKLSTGKKHKSHEDQIREAHAESECPGSECAASLKQVFQNAGKRHPCLLHDSDRAGEKPFCLQKWIHNQWVQRARCLLARIFLQKGKCFIGVAESHVVHTQFYKALGVIRGCNWTFLESSCPSSLCRVECVVSKSLKDHKIEEGCILYHLGIFILREQICNNLRIGCCDLECVDVSIILSWLHHAFVLCKDIPLLLQKVARILAILHVPKDMGGLFDRLLKPNFQSTKKAAYFHQLSLGPTVRQQHISLLDARKLEIFKSSDLSHNRQSIVNMQNLIRVGPSMPNDLQSAVQEDYKVPCPTICLSLMDWEMQYLHNDLDAVRSHSWVLISRFDIDSGPLSILIPCGSFIGRSLIAECPYNVESEDEASSSVESQTMTAYGTLASEFKSILEESRQSTSQEVCIDSHEEKSRWWEWRIALDARLASMLRDLEEVWFGPWKSLLLGKSSSSSTHIWRPIAEGLDRRLQSLTKAGPFNVDLIQLLLQGAGSFSRRDLEKGISCLFDWKTSSQILKDMQSTVCESSDSNSKHDSLLNSAVEAFIESFEMAIQSEAYLPVTSLDDTNSILSYVKQRCTHQVSYTTECNSYQEPVVLALDSHLQALPWESLPVLRRKEVYRVPSLGSMNVLLIHRYFLEMFKSGQHAARQYEEEHNNEVDAWSVMGGPMVVVPTVDPSNTYFLLNPSGDLGSTQAAFEDMFTCQEGWEGKVGEAPTVEEYMEGLKKHELFVYFGHGSGDQYLSERRMRKMDRCAAALLMGCSSGRLHPQGDYEPVGVPLWYLMAGCPTAISNLWDVTDGDIDRFSRVLLQNWLVSGHRRPEATGSVNTHMQKSVRGECHKGKRRGHKLCMAVKGSGGPTLNVTVHDSGIRTASNIGEGRNACRLPNLIGASPVCYGIPTFVRRKTT